MTEIVFDEQRYVDTLLQARKRVSNVRHTLIRDGGNAHAVDSGILLQAITNLKENYPETTNSGLKLMVHDILDTLDEEG